MFDLGTMGEIFIIALAVLILVGPKEMPTVLRTLGRLVQKVKFLTSNVRYEITKHLQDGELEEYTKRINQDVMSSAPGPAPTANKPKTKAKAKKGSST